MTYFVLQQRFSFYVTYVFIYKYMCISMYKDIYTNDSVFLFTCYVIKKMFFCNAVTCLDEQDEHAIIAAISYPRKG